VWLPGTVLLVRIAAGRGTIEPRGFHSGGHYIKMLQTISIIVKKKNTVQNVDKQLPSEHSSRHLPAPLQYSEEANDRAALRHTTTRPPS